MLEIQVDRGDGKGFVILAFDTTPVKWTYKAIFRLNYQRMGQWSDPVSTMVG